MKGIQKTHPRREVTVKGSKVAMRVKQEGKEVVFWQWVWKGFIQTSPLTLFSNFRCILLPLYFNLHVDSPPPPLFLNWNIWQSGIISRLKKKKKASQIILRIRCTVSQSNITEFGFQKANPFTVFAVKCGFWIIELMFSVSNIYTSLFNLICEKIINQCKSHGQRSLAGFSPLGGKESDTIEAIYTRILP